MRAITTILVSVFSSVATYLAMHAWVAPRLTVPSVEAPVLNGMTVPQARAVAEARGLRLIVDDERPSDRAAPGTIFEQRPLAGSMLRRGDELRSVVARRADTVKVPQTAGMTPEAARQLVERAHLRIGQSSQVPDPKVPAGLVIGSQPAADAEVTWGSAVDVKISSGAATAQVPQLFGKRLSSAKTVLGQAGFQLGAVKRGSNDDRDSGEVIGQTPKAGEAAAVGSKVDVVVNE